MPRATTAEPTMSSERHTVIEFSKEELYELNDAIGEVVHRMLNEGQTPQEIKYRSLLRLGTAWQQITVAIFSTVKTPAMELMLPCIANAVNHPKVKP